MPTHMALPAGGRSGTGRAPPTAPQRLALATWEDEGGLVTAPVLSASAARGDACLPTLPPGYEAQPDMGFRDGTGRFVYAFHRVYGEESRPEFVAMRGSAMRLVEDLCYWAVSWSTQHDGSGGGEQPGGRWVTFAQARAGGGARMTFRRFSSLELMRAELPALLRVPGPNS